MREYRIIATFTVLLLLVVVVYFSRRSLAPGAGELDETASRRIAAACGYRQECKVNLGLLFDGDWDTLWEFAPGVSPSVMNSVLPNSNLHAPGKKRLLVLALRGHVAMYAYEPVSTTPIDHEVVFVDAAQNYPAVVRYARDTWLWARSQPAPAGLELYYRLSPDDR